VSDAESHRDAKGHEKKSGNKNLRDIKTDLSNGGVNISAAQRPPSQRTMIYTFRHEGPFAFVLRDVAGTSNFERFE
jgi:hypothetical protein